MDETKVLQKLIEHDEQLERIEQKMVVKDDVHRVSDTLDKAMVILQRLDQERLFTQEWIKRVESEVERHTHEIRQLKKHLNLT